MVAGLFHLESIIRMYVCVRAYLGAPLLPVVAYAGGTPPAPGALGVDA